MWAGFENRSVTFAEPISSLKNPQLPQKSSTRYTNKILSRTIGRISYRYASGARTFYKAMVDRGHRMRGAETLNEGSQGRQVEAVRLAGRLG